MKTGKMMALAVLGLMADLLVGPMLGMSGVARADDFAFQKGDKYLYAIENVKTTVKAQIPPHCPPNAMCEIHSEALIEFTIGCADRAGPVTVAQHYDDNSRKVILDVTAFGVATKASEVVRCFRAPVAQVRVPLGFGIMTEQDLEVRMHSYLTPVTVY